MKAGDIVKSKVTGNEIKVVAIWDSFITGYIVGFVPSDHFHLKMYNGFAILSFKNMEQSKAGQLELF